MPPATSKSELHPDTSPPVVSEDVIECGTGRTISRYMVLLAGEQKLIIMRPYQIYAVQPKVKCIDNDDGNGFVWHTTGSGKTLTSFKASTLLKENDSINKCVFVMDRKDLDFQTREEFTKFQKSCVEENTNTAALVRHRLSEDYANKVILRPKRNVYFTRIPHFVPPQSEISTRPHHNNAAFTRLSQ